MRNSSNVRLLTLKLQEPVPGLVLPEIAELHGPDEAARRYKAVVLTTLRQLRGLPDARLRLLVDPHEADEAVRFWLLPRLAEQWQAVDGIFKSEGWQIDFGGRDDEFSVHAEGDIMCPNLGARWVHAALLGMGRAATHVVGPATDGGVYFRAQVSEVIDAMPTRILPELPVIRTHDDWLEMLEGILGPALRKAWEAEK